MARPLKSAKITAFDFFSFLGISFLLLFIPLYPKFPLFAVSGTYVSVRFEDLLVAFLLGTFVLRLIYKRDFTLLKKRFFQLAVLYFGAGLLSVISGIFITKNITSHLAFLHWLRRVEYLSLLFVAYYSFKEIKQLRAFGEMLFLSTLGVIIYGLGQKFFGWPVVSTMNKEFSKGLVLRLTWWARVNSTFAGHYDLAAYLVLILCLTAMVLVLAKSWKTKFLVLILGLLSYYLLLMTASRISFMAYLLGVVFILLLGKKLRWIPFFLTLSIVGMIFAGDLGQRYAATFKIDLSFLSGLVQIRPSSSTLSSLPTPTPTPTVYLGPGKILPPGKVSLTVTPTPEPVATASVELFEPTALAVGRSTNIRLKVEWPRAIAAFLKNPLLGTGYSSITLATDNDYLRMLGETGLLGFFAFFGLVFEIAGNYWKTILSKGVSREGKLLLLGIAGASMAYFFNAVFIDVLESSKIAFIFWILIGIGLKIVDLEAENER